MDRTLPSLTLTTTAAAALIEVLYALVPSSLTPWHPHIHTHIQIRSTIPHTCVYIEKNPGENLAHAKRRLAWRWASRRIRKTFVREFSGKFHVQSCKSFSTVLSLWQSSSSSTVLWYNTHYKTTHTLALFTHSIMICLEFRKIKWYKHLSKNIFQRRQKSLMNRFY